MESGFSLAKKLHQPTEAKDVHAVDLLDLPPCTAHNLAATTTRAHGLGRLRCLNQLRTALSFRSDLDSMELTFGDPFGTRLPRQSSKSPRALVVLRNSPSSASSDVAKLYAIL